MGNIQTFPELIQISGSVGSFYPDVSQDNRISSLPGACRISDLVRSAEVSGSDPDLQLTSLPVASGDDYYTVMSAQWADYISGIVQNLGNTEYIAYQLRDYTSSSSYSYVDHYIIVYDLELDGDQIVAGKYPYIDIYRNSSGNSYTTESGTTATVTVPDVAYGSFGSLSELREGGGVHVEYALLFAVVVAFIYSIIHDIFDHTQQLGKRKG